MDVDRGCPSDAQTWAVGGFAWAPAVARIRADGSSTTRPVTAPGSAVHRRRHRGRRHGSVHGHPQRPARLPTRPWRIARCIAIRWTARTVVVDVEVRRQRDRRDSRDLVATAHDRRPGDGRLPKFAPGRGSSIGEPHRRSARPVRGVGPALVVLFPGPYASGEYAVGYTLCTEQAGRTMLQADHRCAMDESRDDRTRRPRRPEFRHDPIWTGRHGVPCVAQRHR